METVQNHSQSRFNEPWLDSCFNATLFPGSPWQKVSQKIGDVLAEKLKPALQDTKRRQMIFKLLGHDFVETYFSEYPNFPSLLLYPNMSELEYTPLEKKTQAWLLKQCTKAAEETGCNFSDGELSMEMTSFVNHTYSLVEKEMELHLAKHEIKEKESNSNVNRFMLRSFLKQRRNSVQSADIHFTVASPSTIKLKHVKGNTIIL
ncbi:uncharacterized protein LOC134612022 [Pelobates fuscus]|uniref:uncharacterized protein LOC134612022 n=1 Tax=Pelobates fuscus TaxID=191477 RepID=UPI002FE4F8B8